MSITKNKVSIILPVYNGEKTLRATIESLLSQSYKNFELLIGIDGTKDKSKKIAETFNDDRIKIFENLTNIGLAKNLNKLVLKIHADSEYIAIAEQDDIYVLDRLKWQVEIMEKYPEVGLVSGIAEFVSDTSNILFPGLLVKNEEFKQGKELFKFLYVHQLKVVNSCLMIRKHVHLNNQIIFKNTYGNFNVDWDYVLRMTLVTKIYGIPKVLVKINRKTNNNSVTKQKWLQFKASRELLKDFRSEFDYLIGLKHYKKALKEHRKIEIGYRNYIGIIFFSMYYLLIYFDLYFLDYLIKKVKNYLNVKN